MGTGISGRGSVNCSGTIIATFRWSGGANLNDPPPKAVVLTETSRASWSGEGGSCDNAKGDPSNSFPNSQISEGTHYRIISNPGIQFNISCAPTANSWLQNPSGDLATCSASVWYKAEATPMRLIVGGALWKNGKDNALIGQGLVLSVDAGDFELSSYSWMPDGSWFHHIEYGPAHEGQFGTYYEYRRVWGPPSEAFSQPTFQLYYDTPNSNQRLDVTVNISKNGVTIGTVQLTKILSVWSPYYLFNIQGSASTYQPDSEGAELVQAGDQANGIVGMLFIGRVGTPAMFALLGSGDWAFSQLMTLDRWQIVSFDWLPNRTRTNYMVLDNVMFYEGPWPSDSTAQMPTQHLADDSPDYWFFLLAREYSVQDIYHMSQIYLPPQNSSGIEAQWVPLRYHEWTWDASGCRNLLPPPASPWSGPGGGAFDNGVVEFPGWQYQWDEVYFNSE